MTVEEFKKLKPEYKDINDERLWNAMEDYVLQTGKTWIPLEQDGFTENTVEYPTCSITFIEWNTYICLATGETKSSKEFWGTNTISDPGTWRMDMLDFGLEVRDFPPKTGYFKDESKEFNN